MSRRNISFGEMLTDLRAEAHLSSNPSVGVDVEPKHKRLLNRIYATIYDDYDWPHMRMTSERMTLSAGQRYYNPPAGINLERIEKVAVWWNGEPSPVSPGISFSEYAVFDSEIDERSDPVQRYDIKSTSEGSDQIEVWPVPASNDTTLQFVGTRAAPTLVNSTDLCLLDADVIVLFAAAELLAKSKSEDANLKLAAAQKRLQQLRARAPQPTSDSGENAPSIGTGPRIGFRDGRATVSIGRN